MAGTIDDAVRWWAAERAEVPALEVDREAITWAELDAWAGRLARRLLDEGVKPRDRVSLFVANSIEWCVAEVAIMRVGAIVCGFNSRMKPAEILYLIEDYAPVLMFADAEGLERLNDIPELAADGAPKVLPVSDIRALQHGAPADVRVALDPKWPVGIITTSGSTARPKGVVYSHETMIAYTAAQGFEDPVTHADIRRVMITGPMSASAGFVVFTQSLIHGGTAFLVSKFDPEETLRILQERNVNTFPAAPIFFQRIAALPQFKDADLSALRTATTGGAPVNASLLEAWRSKGVILRQIYGLSECGGHATVNPRRFALTHPDRCGHGGVLSEIAIIDEDGKLLPAGREGQIVVRGPGNMVGYWNNPKATAEVFVDGWLRTGDIGVIDELGLLKYVDRLKDIIISGGLNISAAEVERVILELPGVEDVAVIAAPDEKFGETPCAIVYGAAAPGAAAIVAHCDANLSNFKVPRYVVLAETPLPRLATGKVSKPLLRATYASAEKLGERVR